MELLVTIRNKSNYEKLLALADGAIVGNRFTTSYHLDNNDIVEINNYCKANNKKVYIVIDNFISEDELLSLNEYFYFIEGLNVDGIYFHDLGIYTIADSYGLKNKLIYDGKSVLCNSLDSAYMLSKGIDSVLISRELTLKEIKDIVKNNDGQVDLQIFGHIRLSYSKRKFLSNYFREINREYDYLNKESLFLIEEKRDYKMPIVEDNDGTFIYSDFVVEMFEEMPELSSSIKRGIVDTLFINDDNKIVEVCRNYKRINEANAKFLKESLYHNYPDRYSKGYLYQKTNITKDE